MSQPTAGTITELAPRARRGEPPAGRTLVSGLTSPQGMAFDRLGEHEVLDVAESDQVDRYVAGTAEDYGDMRFDADAQANPGGRRLDCPKLPRIDRGLPAHSAPLGFHFLAGSTLPTPWRNGAVVAVHGSWDRHPPRPPAVLWLPWDASARTLGSAITLVRGFQDPSGSRWGRTVDAVPGPDGALYVSDDQTGAIYRIVPSRSG